MDDEHGKGVSEEEEYVLGTEAQETERLRFQHQAWSAAAQRILVRAGLGAGDRVLDLGCGPGYTSLVLADLVGPEGRVVACDQSERFLTTLEAECTRLGVSHVQASLGPVEELDLEPGGLDGVYARWLFCWLPAPGEVLERVAAGLRPRGVIVLQEYLDWAAMGLLPGSSVFDRAIAACMESFARSGGTIDVGRDLPRQALDLGLLVESVEPVARVGAVGSLEWRWLEQFLWSYLPKLVQAGTYTQEEWSAFRAEWTARARTGRTWIQAPTMVDLVLRVP